MLEYKYDPYENYKCVDNIRSHGFSYLQFLIINSHKIENSLKLIQEEIDNNIDDKNYINYHNNEGFTALMLSCFSKGNSIEIIKLLLKNGAHVELKDKEGNTALAYACKYSNICSSIEIIKLLIKKGANINSKNNIYWTPLHLSCSASDTTSSLDTVKLLLDKGANINSRSKCGATPLMASCLSRCDEDYIGSGSSLDTIKLLLDKGANVNIRDINGYNCIDILTGYLEDDCPKAYDIVSLLINKNINIDYGRISECVKNNMRLFELCINKIDFNDIDKVKKIYFEISDNKLFSSMLRIKLMSLSDKYNELEKMYIYSNMNDEDYAHTIKTINKLKRKN